MQTRWPIGNEDLIGADIAFYLYVALHLYGFIEVGDLYPGDLVGPTTH